MKDDIETIAIDLPGSRQKWSKQVMRFTITYVPILPCLALNCSMSSSKRQFLCRDDVLRLHCRIKKLKTFNDIMRTVGVNKDSVGCEVCKPAIGSILASLWNEHVVNPVHHA